MLSCGDILSQRHRSYFATFEEPCGVQEHVSSITSWHHDVAAGRNDQCLPVLHGAPSTTQSVEKRSYRFLMLDTLFAVPPCDLAEDACAHRGDVESCRKHHPIRIPGRTPAQTCDSQAARPLFTSTIVSRWMQVTTTYMKHQPQREFQYSYPAAGGKGPGVQFKECASRGQLVRQSVMLTSR